MTAVSLRYAKLKRLAKQLKRPFGSLYVLSAANDPFLCDMRIRRASAEWFASLWRTLGIEPPAHLRRIHYRAISQDPPLTARDGEDYVNIEKHWDDLCTAGRDARYLNLIAADDFVDRRNPEAKINLDTEVPEDATVSTYTGHLDSTVALTLPTLALSRPIIPQRYHLEIICEKSTINDILDPLGEDYGVNIVTSLGEVSYTRVLELVKRAIASGRPVRVLYISDFDPAGMSMPVAFARKIEWAVRSLGVEHLDIQLHPVGLTYEQCVHYRLPRTPLKDSERRAARFEARFGEGATELDALEALHPGELRNILVREIERYYDTDLENEIDEVTREASTDLARAEHEVYARHRKDIAVLEAERKKLAKAIAQAEKKARPILRRIERDLAAAAPDAEYAWPEPCDGDERDDPLFASTRSYVEQVDRYKQHQGKAAGFKLTQKICEVCGGEYEAMRSNSRACSVECRRQLRYLPGGERAKTG